MRSFLSVLAGLVAVVAALATVPLLWISTNVVDEDGYVALSSRLATDTELQSAFADYLADDYVRRGVLPRSLQSPAADALALVARGTSTQPGFVRAWEETQRSFHASAFGTGDGPLTVQVAPMAEFVTQRVGDRLPVSLQVPSDLVVAVGSAQERAEVQRIERARTLGLLGLLVVVVAAATSFFAARSRPAALAGLGAGALAVAAILRVATSQVTPRILDRTPAETPFARSLQQLLVDRAADSLAQWLVWIAVAGGAAVVVGLGARVVTGRPAA